MAPAGSSCDCRAGKSSSTGGVDYSGDPRFTECAGRSVWLSPVYFDGLDPFMAIAMAHSGRNAGSTVAEVNLKFLSMFIDRSQIGKDDEAYVVGPSGRLLAHSDPDRRLGTDLAELPQVAAMVHAEAEPVTFGKDPDGRSVLTAAAPIPRLNWYVFFEQPLSQALQPVYSLLYRTGWLLALGIVLAVLAGMLLARQMVDADPRPAGRRAATGSERFRPPHRGSTPATRSRSWPTSSTEWRSELQESYGRARAEGRGTHARSAPSRSAN